jgi:hypothetical protein
MIWLQQQERHDTFAEFDPGSSVLTEHRRKNFGRRPPHTPHGFYSKLGDLLLAIYGVAGKLFLAFDKQVIEIGVDETIEVNGPRSARTLRVVNGLGVTLLELDYCLDGIPGPIPHDPTPCVEDEDRDIGLFASNISKNSERRALFTDK